MSRMSRDEYRYGCLYNGYDYENQAWVRNGRYVCCGHPATVDCRCYGRLHQGEAVNPFVDPEEYI